MEKGIRKFIGSKEFYQRVLLVVVPVIIQNAITNFVGMLDNIMVGRVGTEQMSGVSIANQLIFVFSLCIFGAISGAGIFTAQFYGAGNEDGVRQTMRFKIMICLIIGALFTVGFGVFGDKLAGFYLTGEGDATSIAKTAQYAHMYMQVMLLGLIPWGIVQAYAGTLRECGETMVPMVSGIIAVCVNLLFNYILIYGKFGAPQMGVVGAAIATVLSRFVELAIVVIYAHAKTKRFPFMKGLFRGFSISKKLFADIVKTGTPLLLNETMWAAGMSFLAQCYSVRGIDVVGGLNISNTIGNLFNTVYLSMGTATAIIVGQELGAGKLKTVKDTVWKLMGFSVFLSAIMGVFLALTSGLFPLVYNTTDSVRAVASGLIRVNALCAPINAITNVSYFTLRSGGKTFITFLFDSVFVWTISVPFAFVMCHYSSIFIILVVLMDQLLDLLKVLIGIILIRKGIWIHNMAKES